MTCGTHYLPSGGSHRVTRQITVETSNPHVQVEASAHMAAPNNTLTGADIAAAITACGTNVCQVNLVAGTYTDVCLEITRDQGTHIIGKGTGVTILKPYADLDNCTATADGAMLTFRGASNIELAHVELDGDKQSTTFPTCNPNFCGGAIREFDSGEVRSVDGWLHHLYIHDFVGTGLETGYATNWLLERSTIENMGCNQTDNSCGCTLGAGCGGWDAAPDLGGGNKSQANALGWAWATRNSTARFLTVGFATHAGIEISGDCAATPQYCPDNNEMSDNVVASSVVVNGATHARVLRNRVTNPGATGGTGDVGVGILVTTQSHNHVLVEDNWLEGNDSSGITIKSSGPGGIIVRGNTLKDNCTDHANNGDIWIWAFNTGGSYARDILVENNRVTGSTLCTHGLLSNAGSGQAFTGSVRFIGGSYAAGSVGAVTVTNANLEMRGVNVAGNLLFDTGATGLAVGNTVSGSTTNTGGVCILENDSTPIPSTCVNP